MSEPRLSTADLLPDPGSGMFPASLGEGLAIVFLVPTPASPTIGSSLHIGADGRVTVFTGKVEVGQGIRTAFTQLVAEELCTPVTSVTVVMGDTDRTPYDLGTFSSLSIRTIGTQLRRSAAAARELLLELAAETWPGASPVIADGRITDPVTGRSVSFRELAIGRSVVHTVQRSKAVTPAAAWTIAGRGAPLVRGREFVTGSHRYASDIAVPGMRHGKMLRPPAYGLCLREVDTRAAEALPDITVFRADDVVGVTAPDERAATHALAAVRAAWSPDAGVTLPSAGELFAHLRSHPAEVNGRNGPVNHVTGSLDAGYAAADAVLRETYTTSYLAHAPMEPRAAVARWTDDAVTVWTGTQRPFAVRGQVALALDVPEDHVRVIVPDVGSAFGGKHSGDAAVEAALLARAERCPVKVLWTREEEFTWAYFRPAAVIDVASGATTDGELTAWEHHCHNAGAEGLLTPYRARHQHITFHPAQSPLRQGPYRGLAVVANRFAAETHMDELARALQLDPLEVRRRNLDDERLLTAFETAADTFGWDRRSRLPGHGFGIAGGTEKGGYVATCAEVAVAPDGASDAGRVTVVRVVTAFECGAIVNPGHLRAQIEGATLQGLGGALFEAVQLDDARMGNPDFTRYRVPRFADVPALEVVLLDRTDLPSAGAGECPILGIAPALGNAIFDAAGVRLRALPLVPHGVAAEREEAL